MPVLATRMLTVPCKSQLDGPNDQWRFIVRVPGLPSSASLGMGATPWAQEIRGAWELAELHWCEEEADNGSSQGKKIICINSMSPCSNMTKRWLCLWGRWLNFIMLILWSTSMPSMKSAIPGQMCYTYEWRTDNFKRSILVQVITKILSINEISPEQSTKITTSLKLVGDHMNSKWISVM